MWCVFGSPLSRGRHKRVRTIQLRLRKPQFWRRHIGKPHHRSALRSLMRLLVDMRAENMALLGDNQPRDCGVPQINHHIPARSNNLPPQLAPMPGALGLNHRQHTLQQRIPGEQAFRQRAARNRDLGVRPGLLYIRKQSRRQHGVADARGCNE